MPKVEGLIPIAAAEAAIGLAIVSSIYRNRKSTHINQSNLLSLKHYEKVVGRTKKKESSLAR
ncbi:hypothetical protein R6Q57_019746 [Mikania cordata]